MQKGNFIQRVLQFAEKQGFYMILGLCVVAIGVSAYVLFFTAPQPQGLTGEIVSDPVPQPDASVSNPVPNVTAPQPEVKAQPPVSKPAPQVKQPEKQPEAPSRTVVTAPETEEKTPAAVRENTPKDVKETIFTLPVQSAEIQREYSGESLVFDPTMGDWRTHNGTDFICETGADVMAVLDGTVTDIYEDAMMGNCIRIDHGANLESLYCGVKPVEQLEKGDLVSVGQIIGSAGAGVLAESAQECHLHLEMYDEGYHVDPMTVLK